MLRELPDISLCIFISEEAKIRLCRGAKKLRKIKAEMSVCFSQDHSEWYVELLFAVQNKRILMVV